MGVACPQITLPLPDAGDDGRPKALQIETAAIHVKNSPLIELMNSSHFSDALQALKEGWVFTSQDDPQFPHYQNDLRALPTRLQELLQQRIRTGRKRGEVSSDESSGSSATGLAPEANKSEMEAIEGWHVNTACVHVAFVDSYTHKATLRTRTFVDDFPLHLWLFLPPSSLDSSLPSSPSISPHSDKHKDPNFSIIAHIPSDICVELERLQLLFLMRLKDSFAVFKSSLMKFLDPNTFAPHLKETLEAHRVASDDAEEVTPPMTISGCIALSRVEASILLPTLSATSTPSSNVAASKPGSNMGILLTDLQTLPTEADLQALPTEPRTATEADAVRQDSDRHITRSVPMVTSDNHQPSQANISPIDGNTTLPPEASPTSSRTSLPGSSEPSIAEPPNPTLASEASITCSPSPSMSSLPSILESEEDGTFKLSHTKPPYASTSQLLVHTPGSNQPLPPRSLSAAELLLLQQKPAQKLGEVPQELLNEDDFVIVKHPAMSPHSEPPSCPPVSLDKPASLDKPVSPQPSSPAVLAVETQSSGRTSPVLPPSSSVSPTYSINSVTLSTQSTSSRRQKSPTPLRTLPRFVLHAQVQHIFVIPNIKAGEISARVSVDSIRLRELSTREYQGMKEMMKKRSAHVPPPPAGNSPSIKARLEVGDQVGRFYPSDCSQDIILMAKVEDLDVSLLLPNIAIMKDFFDDEFEIPLPLPMHLKVATTRAVLVEDLSHGTDHEQSMSVNVEQLEVHRGRELKQGVDVFLEESASEILR